MEFYNEKRKMHEDPLQNVEINIQSKMDNYLSKVKKKNEAAIKRVSNSVLK